MNVNIHIDINMNTDIHIIIDMNFEDYIAVIYYLLGIPYSSLLGIPYWPYFCRMANHSVCWRLLCHAGQLFALPCALGSAAPIGHQ